MPKKNNLFIDQTHQASLRKSSAQFAITVSVPPALAMTLRLINKTLVSAGFDPPAIEVNLNDPWQTDNEPMAQFIIERCELGEMCSESSSTLCRVYQEWYGDNISQKRIPSSIAIGKKLTVRFPDNYKSGGYTIYRGVRLLPVIVSHSEPCKP